jgi:hypothetical protein
MAEENQENQIGMVIFPRFELSHTQAVPPTSRSVYLDKKEMNRNRITYKYACECVWFSSSNVGLL